VRTPAVVCTSGGQRRAGGGWGFLGGPLIDELLLNRLLLDELLLVGACRKGSHRSPCTAGRMHASGCGLVARKLGRGRVARLVIELIRVEARDKVLPSSF
jgi:hypothetical protein